VIPKIDNDGMFACLAFDAAFSRRGIDVVYLHAKIIHENNTLSSSTTVATLADQCVRGNCQE
jgi:hypothetical protein